MSGKTTRKDIENALMRGADTLRDTIDAANYKDYVLPIMFIKYLYNSIRIHTWPTIKSQITNFLLNTFFTSQIPIVIIINKEGAIINNIINFIY